jgi:hypothetical protein
VPNPSTDRVPGLITADTLYTLHELKLRLGLGTHAMRSARRSGLKVRYVVGVPWC